MAEEIVQAKGHEHVTGRHESTFEVTSDDYLTPAGDCILGIESDRVPTDFSDLFISACKDESTTIEIVLEAAGHTETVTARGDSDLTFKSDRSMVVRTSDYVDDRTIAVEASKAAGELDRNLVDALADGADLTMRLRVDPA